MILDVGRFQWMTSVADDVTDGAAFTVETESPRNFAVVYTRSDETDNLGVSRSQFGPLGVECVTPFKGGLGFCSLDYQVRKQPPKKLAGLREIADPPVVLGLPFHPVVCDDVYHADVQAFLNGLNDYLVCARNGDVDTSHLRQIDATFTIKETGEPTQKLFVRPIFHVSNVIHMVVSVPLPMGRAIAKAVRRALEEQANG